jgi:APA family basic amino acid/polyamine antiporter
MLLPRVYYAMARDGAFLSTVGQLHPRFGTPARAIALQAFVASLLIALGTFEEIVAYFVFVTVVFIALTVAGVYVIRGRSSAPAPPRPLPGYPVTPAVFLLSTLMLLGLLGANRPREALIGVVVVALGVPVYAIVGAARPMRIDEQEGPA